MGPRHQSAEGGVSTHTAPLRHAGTVLLAREGFSLVLPEDSSPVPPWE